jgi:hypothetical protein
MNDLIQQIRALGFQKHPLVDFGLAHYYHADQDFMIQVVPSTSFLEIKKQDKVRVFQQHITQLRSQFKTVIRIWEDVWLNKKSWISQFLTSKFEPPRSIFARDTRVVEISKDLAESFLAVNHLLGFLPGSRYYACIVPPHRHFRIQPTRFRKEENPLIMVAVFGQVRHMKRGDLAGKASGELIQVATDPDVRCVGGLSKLISTYANELHLDNLMTYTDLEWSDGHAFQQIGFVSELESPPLYFSHDTLGLRKISQNPEDALVCNSGNLKMRITFNHE